MLVLINSSDRIRGTHSKFSVKLPAETHNFKKVRLLHATIPNTELLINDYTIAIKIFFGDDSHSVSTQLNNGNYTSTEIIQELESKFNIASSVSGASPCTITVTYNTHTQRISISSTLQIRLEINKELSKILGFPETTSFSYSHIGTNPVFLNPPRYLLIDSNFTKCAFCYDSSGLAIKNIGNFFIFIKQLE